MATTTAPDVQPKTAAPVLTPSAIAKVKEIMASQTAGPVGIAVVRSRRRLLRLSILHGLRERRWHDGQGFRL